MNSCTGEALAHKINDNDENNTFFLDGGEGIGKAQRRINELL